MTRKVLSPAEMEKLEKEFMHTHKINNSAEIEKKEVEFLSMNF